MKQVNVGNLSLPRLLGTIWWSLAGIDGTIVDRVADEVRWQIRRSVR